MTAKLTFLSVLFILFGLNNAQSHGHKKAKPVTRVKFGKAIQFKCNPKFCGSLKWTKVAINPKAAGVYGFKFIPSKTIALKDIHFEVRMQMPMHKKKEDGHGWAGFNQTMKQSANGLIATNAVHLGTKTMAGVWWIKVTYQKKSLWFKAFQAFH